MRLGEFLDRGRILPDLAARDKPGALAELAAPLAQVPGVDADAALRVLLERERLGSTAIGQGVAIPHGKLPGLDDVLLCVGRSRQGVDFGAQDLLPCRIFFLVLAPEQTAGLHLRMLAHISRLLRDSEFRRAFLEASGDEELWNLLKDS